MKLCTKLVLGFSWGILLSMAHAQDLPLSRRVFSLAPNIVNGATQVAASPVAGASGSVLIIFRTSEQGAVMDMRSTGGTDAMRQSAEAALQQWRFKPFTLSGQPIQIYSAVVLDFSNGTATFSTPKPMSAQQLSPRLGFPCSNALSHHDAGASDLCKKQLDGIERDSLSTPMERFTGHDEYGVALLYAHQPKLALEQFSSAIPLAPKGLKDSDAEWAYVYWHRGIAEAQVGDAAASQQDLAVAQHSIALAEAAIGASGVGYYHRLAEQIVPGKTPY